MPLQLPNSMEECIYFTRRSIGQGSVIAWTTKQPCPKCGKAMMSKPRGDKGKVMIRAKEYACPACKYTSEKSAYEDTLSCNIQYVCPACKHSGETTAPFKRKTWQGVKAIVFECAECKAKTGITKKMKVGKKKGAENAEIEDADDDF